MLWEENEDRGPTLRSLLPRWEDMWAGKKLMTLSMLDNIK